MTGQEGHYERGEPDIAISIGTAISVASGKLLCDFGDLHDAVTDLAGWNVMTHHMANQALMDGVAAKVYAQVPWMAGAVENMPDWSALPADQVKPAIERWLDRIRAHYGDEVLLTIGDPLPPMGLLDGLERLGADR